MFELESFELRHNSLHYVAKLFSVAGVNFKNYFDMQRRDINRLRNIIVVSAYCARVS